MEVSWRHNPTELLTALHNSVQRGGPVFTGQATLHPDGAGHRCTLQLAPGAFNDNDTGKQLKKALGEYMRSFLRENGWRTKGVSIKRGYVELFITKSSAASSASNRP